ncbi:hypothetical protein GGR58DRAFT_507195 [Xylaria digitata]|nr:hypothetical protein GGR58DRAFT_507195 [Xylaria digitata]
MGTSSRPSTLAIAARGVPYDKVLLLSDAVARRVRPMNTAVGSKAKQKHAAHAKLQHLGAETAIAVIPEPGGGAVIGCVTVPRGYCQSIHRLRDKHDNSLILNETTCRATRKGTLFVVEQEDEGAYPEHSTPSNILEGGYPLLQAC